MASRPAHRTPACALLGAVRSFNPHVDSGGNPIDHRSVQRIGGLLASAVMVLMGGDAAAQNARATNVGKIGIGAIGPAGLPADLRIRLEDAAANGLKASGADVVTATELSRVRASASLGSCADALCEQRLAQVTDTRYWLRGTCQLDTSTYRLHLELVDARSGAVVVARDDTCDICTEADAAETASAAASSLKAALGRTPALMPGAAVARVQPAATAPPPVALAPSPSGAVPRSQAEESSGRSGSTWRRVLPWVTFGAAAGAVASGVYYLVINGQGNCPEAPRVECTHVYDTVWRWGVPLLAVGAVFATTGIVLLTIGDSDGDGDSRRGNAGGAAAHARRTATPSRTTQLAVSPGGLMVLGSF